MGGSSSKTGENKGIQEESSGLHIVEIHAPTVGLGFTMLILAMIFSCAAYACYRQIKKRTQRRMNRPRNMELQRNNLIEIPMMQIPPSPRFLMSDAGPRFQEVTEDPIQLQPPPQRQETRNERRTIEV